MEYWTIDKWIADLNSCADQNLYFEISGYDAGFLSDKINSLKKENERLREENEMLQFRLRRIDTYRLKRLELSGVDLLDVATPYAASLNKIANMLDGLGTYLGDDVRMALESWNNNFALGIKIRKLQTALRYYADKKENEWKNGDDGVVARAALEEGE